jgi:trigger factor
MFEEFKNVLPEDELAAKASVTRDLIKNARRTLEFTLEEIASFEARMEEEIEGRFSPIEEESGSRMVVVGWHDANCGDDISEEEMEKKLSEIAEQYKMDLEKVKDILGEGARKDIEKDMKVEKAVDLIVEAAKEV